MKDKPEIAIIGAGIAGLSCARRIQTAGYPVTVFDKSRGPSGRMSTRRGEDWQCDHGAQYFTARHPLFRAEVERWQKAGVAAEWTPRLTVFGDNGGHEPDEGLQRFVGVPRMTSPARWLADELHLITQATVHTVISQPEGWQIISHEHGVHAGYYAAVIVAIPAPQAVLLLQSCAPALAEVAHLANMRPSWALMVNYDQALELPYDAAFVNTGPLRWIARNNSKPGRPQRETWLLHATAEWSNEHIEESPQFVADTLLTAFTECGAPRSDAWTAHRWRYADTVPPLTHGALWETQHRIGMCGDWLNGGKVEGAWLSGQKLAEEILVSALR